MGEGGGENVHLSGSVNDYTVCPSIEPRRLRSSVSLVSLAACNYIC